MMLVAMWRLCLLRARSLGRKAWYVEWRRWSWSRVNESFPHPREGSLVEFMSEMKGSPISSHAEIVLQIFRNLNYQCEKQEGKKTDLLKPGK